MLKYSPRDRLITSDKYGVLKHVECPLVKKWGDLDQLEDLRQSGFHAHKMPIERKRYCGSCDSYVFNLDGLSEEQIEGACLTNPDICVHASFPHAAIEFVEEQSAEVTKCPTFRRGYDSRSVELPDDMPVIKTLRTLPAINEAIASGLRVLLKPVKSNPDVEVYLRLREDADGLVEKWVDLRDMFGGKNKPSSTRRVLPIERDILEEFRYNPYTSPEPFAAYVIPDDLQPDQTVFIPDLIECVVGKYLNHGGSVRQKFIFATWNGEDFELPDFKPVELIG